MPIETNLDSVLRRLTDPSRLLALAETGLLDSPAEESFERLARLAARLLRAPTALVSLVDDRRQFFKAGVGVPEPIASRRETPLSQSFCKIVVATAEPLVVVNAQADTRVAGNSAIIDLGVMAYLGFPIRLPTAEVIGSFCVIDSKPREWTPAEIAIVEDLAAAVESEVALRLNTKRLTDLAVEADRASEERAVLLNAIGEGVYGVNAEGRCTFANASALKTLGYQLSEVLGRDMHALIHYKHSDGRPYPKDDCPMLHAVRTGQAVRLENELLWRKDGSSLSAEYCSYPIVQSDVVVGSVLTFNDTTYRNDALKRLAVQYAVSQVLVEALPPDEAIHSILAAIGEGLGWDAGAFWSVDAPSSQIRVVGFWSSSRSSVAALQTKSETLTLGLGEGLPGRVWQSGQPIGMDIDDTSDLLRREEAVACGQRAVFAFPVKASGEVLGVLEFFTSGDLGSSEALLQAVAALGGTIGQFLKRVRAEDALRIFQRAIEAVSVGVTISDAKTPDMPLVYCNPAFEQMTGYSREQSIGRNCRFLQGYDTDEQELQALRNALAGDGQCQVVLKNYRADGSYFWNDFTISGVTDQTGRLSHFVGIQVDITERRRDEAALAEAKHLVEVSSEAKSQFIANMSHELRTPLSAIIGYAELLDEEAEELGETASLFRSDIAKVHASAHHLLSLINGVLDISKIESGKMELEIEKFDVATLVKNVMETVTSLFRKRQNALLINASGELGDMYSDQTKLKQCLINLLSNAAKFTENDDVILNIQRNAERIIFRVTDNGVGMSAEQVERLFNRFSQADASTTRRFGGTGLGLAITKAFAEIMGGEVTVRSSEGRGTTFELTLPADATHLAGAAHDLVGEMPNTVGERGPNVLVIDDDPSQRDLVGRFLSRQGFAASFASDGAEGIRLAEKLQPNAILLDVHMPRMDGWSVLTALKESPYTASIPVIMITVEHDRARGMALGADDYLTKPLDWRRLRRALETHCASSTSRSALLVGREGPNRDDLRACLEEQGWDVIVASNLADARRNVETLQPTLCLVDLQGTGAGGIDFINDLQNSSAIIRRTTIAVAGGDAAALISNESAIIINSFESSHVLANEIKRLSSNAIVEAGNG